MFALYDRTNTYRNICQLGRLLIFMGMHICSSRTSPIFLRITLNLWIEIMSSSARSLASVLFFFHGKISGMSLKRIYKGKGDGTCILGPNFFSRFIFIDSRPEYTMISLHVITFAFLVTRPLTPPIIFSSPHQGCAWVQQVPTPACWL